MFEKLAMMPSAHEHAQHLLRIGRFDDARHVAESEIGRIQSHESATELWRLRFIRARVMAFQGHVEEALEYLSALTPPDHSDVESIAALKMYCGSLSCLLGRNDRANRLLSEAEALAHNAGLPSLTGDVLLCRAFLQFRQEDYAGSSNLYRSVVDLAEIIANWNLRGHGLWGIGKNLMIQCQYTDAMSWFETSLEVFEANSAVLWVSTTWSELGVCYLGIGADQKAMELFRKSERVDYSVGWVHSYQVDLANIGNVYLYRRDYFTALSYYRRALSLAREIKDPVSVKKWTYNINLAYARIKAGVDQRHPGHAERSVV